MKCCIAAACLLAASVGSASDGKPWVIINEDCNSTIARLSPEKVSRAGLREHFEQVIYGPTLTHYFINPQAQKACYASDEMERCWDDVGTNGLVRSDVVALKKFYDDGIDPYAVWVDVAREHKVSPWISMRMNDIHGVQEENPLQTSRMFRTRRSSKPSGAVIPCVPWRGMMHFSKPRRLTSPSRCSRLETARISPVKPTSPIAVSFSLTG